MTQRMSKGETIAFVGISLLDVALKLRQENRRQNATKPIRVNGVEVLPLPKKELKPCKWGRCNGHLVFGRCNRCGSVFL